MDWNAAIAAREAAGNVRRHVEAINLSRFGAKPILDVARCDFCGEDFAIQPQDLARIHRVRGRLCCWRPGCRKVLRRAQNQEKNLVNQEAT